MPDCSETDDVVFERLEFLFNPDRMAELMKDLSVGSNPIQPVNSENFDISHE
jgi:hypothetical protein